jgi:hypothetical protein
MGWEYLADPGGYDEIEAYGGQLKIVMEGRDAERDEELGEEDGEGGHDAVVAAALESAMRIAGRGKLAKEREAGLGIWRRRMKHTMQLMPAREVCLERRVAAL